MLRPKVGDTVVIELEVINVFDGSFIYSLSSSPINLKHITAIKPAPPKVGDTVWWVARDSLYGQSSQFGHTLIHIHNTDSRKFAVVAFYGDIPKSVYFEDLRRSFAECVD